MYDEKIDLYEMQTENDVQNFDLVTAYESMFLRYAEFSGRSRRSEYWYAVFANFIVTFALQALVKLFSFSEVMVIVCAVIYKLYGLAIIVPSLALTVRRLHDTGRSAWWLLIALVPFIGVIVFIILMLLNSQPGTNKYGPNPKGK